MRAIGFDFDRTLGMDQSLERRAFAVLASGLGTPIDVNAPEESALIERLLVPFRLAEMPMRAMVAAFVASLPERARSAHLSDEALAERYRDACFSLVDELVVPIDGARDCVDELARAGVTLGILTNGWSPLQERKIARALGAFPGPVLVSDAIGAYKPSADAFAQLERALACDASELWYVGDNPVTDIAGARAYGVHAVWLDGEGLPYPPGLAAPDVRITSLAELVELVHAA